MGQSCCFTETSDQAVESISDYEKYILSTISLTEVEKFSFEGLYVYGKVIDCYDGDTCRIAFYYKNDLIQLSCRMNGYDSPEIKVSKDNTRREYLKKIATEARERLKELVKCSDESGLVKVKFGKFDLYGRPLVDIFVLKDGKDLHINQIMISENFGKIYNGGKKSEW